MPSSLDIDGPGYVVWKKRGVAQVGGVLLVLASLAPGRHHVGVPTTTKHNHHAGYKLVLCARCFERGAVEKRLGDLNKCTAVNVLS